MAARRILVIDDQREVRQMLRTALEMLDKGYHITDVPSGEEAMLEARRNAFDLIVSDIRLPGISGLETSRRLRAALPQAKLIVITGNPSPEFETEAKKLAAAFFVKPLRTEQFLKAVQEALGEQVKIPERLIDESREAPAISDRLATLRRDLGALAVLLADKDGNIAVRAGDVSALDLNGLTGPLAAAFGACLKICGLLGGVVPNNIQFFDGDDFDIYSINVGQAFMLVVVFDGTRGAAQMGPVMRYGRACADDLLNDLAALGVPAMPSSAPAPEEAARPAPPPAVIAIDDRTLDAAAEKLKRKDAHDFWETALGEAAGAGTTNVISFEEAQKRGLFPKELAS